MNLNVVREQLKKVLDLHTRGEAKGTTKVRQELDTDPHFVPLNLATLSATLNKYLVDEYTITNFRDDLLKALQSHAKIVKGDVIEASPDGKLLFRGTELNRESLKKLCRGGKGVLVYEGRYVKGILFGNFNSTSKVLFQDILNKTFETKLNVVHGHGKAFDPGHVNLTGKDSDLGMVPSLEKAASLISDVSNIRAEHYDSLRSKQFKGHLNRLVADLQKVQRSFNIHEKYGRKVRDSYSKEFKQGLLSVSANIVLIQETYENRSVYGSLEGSLVKNLTNVIAKAIPKINFSRNMMEEIEHRIVSAIKGEKVVDTKKTTPARETTTKTSKTTKTKVVSTTPKLPKIRNELTGRSQQATPTNIANLLNYYLQDVVSANMQDPDDYSRGSRKLLTYRTGRFASSVRVERVSVSRSNAITAFYSYMKYPYATFSKGGRQQFPLSRDPKLLIGRSLREIAAEKMGSYLRAVNV